MARRNAGLELSGTYFAETTDRNMLIWMLTFGMLVGLTAAVVAFTFGFGLWFCLLAYSVGGTLGLLSVVLVRLVFVRA